MARRIARGKKVRKRRSAAGTPQEPKIAESSTMKVADLRKMKAPYNPRKVSPEEFASLRASIRFFGFVEPIVWNRRTEHIVGGNTRIDAASEEGFVDVPVMVVDLDEPSEMQLNLALNRISGEWDDAKLRDVLAGLELAGADLAITGFDDDELAKLLADEAEEGDQEPELGALQYRVVVDCRGENEQAELIMTLEKQGWTCRALIS